MMDKQSKTADELAVMIWVEARDTSLVPDGGIVKVCEMNGGWIAISNAPDLAQFPNYVATVERIAQRLRHRYTLAD
jgi:hypothetical protein